MARLPPGFLMLLNGRIGTLGQPDGHVKIEIIKGRQHITHTKHENLTEDRTSSLSLLVIVQK
ncbi:MAG: hypothetical protein HS114_33810 [Anaerolineales bacterium]|nr:hypothetical protein [Anaerolineales bacterium]